MLSPVRWLHRISPQKKEGVASGGGRLTCWFRARDFYSFWSVPVRGGRSIRPAGGSGRPRWTFGGFRLAFRGSSPAASASTWLRVRHGGLACGPNWVAGCHHIRGPTCPKKLLGGPTWKSGLFSVRIRAFHAPVSSDWPMYKSTWPGKPIVFFLLKQFHGKRWRILAKKWKRSLQRAKLVRHLRPAFQLDFFFDSELWCAVIQVHVSVGN